MAVVGDERVAVDRIASLVEVAIEARHQRALLVDDGLGLPSVGLEQVTHCRATFVTATAAQTTVRNFTSIVETARHSILRS